ncbi:MAG: DUF4446 family protein [Candidatus Nealsonbacteria bacterium]|nr:DUF4446 family protein [Candidatus Nealsonbacteria bacterium]
MFYFFKKRKKEPKNLKEVLKQIEELEEKQKKIVCEMESLKKGQKFSIQKIGMVRYNPFPDSIGGNQSFSIALLDANNNGIIITSLYVKEGNRVYGKPVKNGHSEYQLSKEEKRAVARAICP